MLYIDQNAGCSQFSIIWESALLKVKMLGSYVTGFADPEGQGSGIGDAGQDVGSPAKKMRMGSGLAHATDAGSKVIAESNTCKREQTPVLCLPPHVICGQVWLQLHCRPCLSAVRKRQVLRRSM